MEYKDINVFKIGQTQADKEGIKEWLEYLGVEDINHNLPDDNLISSPELVVALAAKRCYMSFEPGLNKNVNKVRKQWDEYLENILRNKHGSTYEHSVFNFAIEGVSRVCTAELNRHRAGVAISEGSQRFIRFSENIPFYLPDSLKEGNNILWDQNEFEDYTDFENRKKQTRDIFEEILSMLETKYHDLEKVWNINNIKKFHTKKQLTSLFRRVMPQGTSTGGVWSLNIRALRHVIAMRSSPGAEEEIAKLATIIGKIMIENCPKVFCDFEFKNGFWVPKYEKV